MDTKIPIIRVYRSWNNRPVVTPDKTGGKKLVESAGYRSTKDQVESLIQAGIRLDANRAMEEWDSVDGRWISPDPTRHPSYDPANATQDALKSNKAIQEQLEMHLETEKKKEKPAEKKEKPAEETAVPPTL